MTKTGGGGGLNDFSILKSTTRWMRMVVCQRLSQISMDKFLEKPPRFGALHWDGKMVKVIAMGVTKEILAVLVSCTLLYEEGKLLGVPTISDSRDLSQADASVELHKA